MVFLKKMLYIGKWKSLVGKIPHALTLKDQNAKTALYKLPKNHWVIALSEIFGPVRNKLLVTVSLDHPVYRHHHHCYHHHLPCHEVLQGQLCGNHQRQDMFPHTTGARQGR